MVDFRSATIRSLRRRYGAEIENFSDETISKAWREFSTSRDYFTNPEIFVSYLKQKTGGKT